MPSELPPTITSNPPVTASKDQFTWAMLCHLSALSGFFIPFGHLIGPLVVWSLKKDEFPLVNDQGKEALNFQITITIYLIISAILIFVLVGIPLMIAVGLFDLIATVIAALKANQGLAYRYPVTLRFLN